MFNSTEHMEKTDIRISDAKVNFYENHRVQTSINSKKRSCIKFDMGIAGRCSISCFNKAQ